MPRFRYDQFMRLGWKVLVPISLLWILAIFAIRAFRNVGFGQGAIFIGGGIVLVVGLLLAFLFPERRVEQEKGIELASDFPVPPIDLEVPPRPTRRKRRERGVGRKREPALASGAPAKEDDGV